MIHSQLEYGTADDTVIVNVGQGHLIIYLFRSRSCMTGQYMEKGY